MVRLPQLRQGSKHGQRREKLFQTGFHTHLQWIRVSFLELAEKKAGQLQMTR